MQVGGKCRKWIDGRRARQTQSDDTRTRSTVHLTKLYEKIQLNMSKNAGEKSGKLCISSILSPKRDITPTKTDTHWRHLKLTCSTWRNSFFPKYWAENLKFAKIAFLVWNFSQPIAFLYETEEKGQQYSNTIRHFHFLHPEMSRDWYTT